MTFLLCVNIHGQEVIELTGEVISKHGTPLPGTSIVLNSNRFVGTITDACGQFTLQVPKGRNDYLMFSMISEPFYFDLNLIKDQDLNKGIVFRIMPFSESRQQRTKNKKDKNITIDCIKFVYKKTFKITDKNRISPKSN